MRFYHFILLPCYSTSIMELWLISKHTAHTFLKSNQLQDPMIWLARKMGENWLCLTPGLDLNGFSNSNTRQRWRLSLSAHLPDLMTDGLSENDTRILCQVKKIKKLGNLARTLGQKKKTKEKSIKS